MPFAAYEVGQTLEETLCVQILPCTSLLQKVKSAVYSRARRCGSLTLA